MTVSSDGAITILYNSLALGDLFSDLWSYFVLAQAI